MFCSETNDKNTLSCDKKIIAEAITAISLLFSIFVAFAASKKVKPNLTNKLVLQIIYSEIIDGVNILMAIFFDAFKIFTFENYSYRMGICFTQMYFGLFSCLWTLTASFLISLRIYDIMAYKSKIFKNIFMKKYTTTISYGIPLIISYIFWCCQINEQSKRLRDTPEKIFYNKTKYSPPPHFRHIYCWFSPKKNYYIFGLVIILLVLNFYFSVIKGALYVKKISTDIRNNEDEGRNSIREKIKQMNTIKYSLCSYPIVSILVWSMFFIIQILFNQRSTDKNGPIAWIYCILISARQIIYTLVYFLTQKQLIKLIFCKKRKKAES